MKCYRTEDETPVTECGGAKFTISRTYHGYSMSEYDVRLLEGDWPADNDMITICDGDEPPHSRHFGGTVTKSGDLAHVTVYTD